MINLQNDAEFYTQIADLFNVCDKEGFNNSTIFGELMEQVKDVI